MSMIWLYLMNYEARFIRTMVLGQVTGLIYLLLITGSVFSLVPLLQIVSEVAISHKKSKLATNLVKSFLLVQRWSCDPKSEFHMGRLEWIYQLSWAEPDPEEFN